ncbi:hypothetical protein D3C80_1922650 [compost metagenome]
MAGQKPQEEIGCEYGVMNAVYLEKGNIERRIQGLKNQVLHADLQEYLAARASGKAFSGKIPGYQYKQRHMKAENPHIKPVQAVHTAD